MKNEAIICPLPGTPSNAAAVMWVHPYGREAIRGELLGQESLESRAQTLAAYLSDSEVQTGQPLLRRFRDNERVLTRAHAAIVEACAGKEPIDPDAEWFLDNFHIITDALREIQTDLPVGYYQELPKSRGGGFAGLPRVYALALDLIAHTDSSLDEANITRFVQAYQRDTILTIGEIWATPIMLRFGLIENLRRLADQMLQTWEARRSANEWSVFLCATTGGESEEVVEHRRLHWLERAIRSLRPPRAGAVEPYQLSDPFVVRLVSALKEHGPLSESGLEWLERRLRVEGVEVSDVIRRENQRQAANQVSVGNCVTSLRLLSALDWMAFFERTSHVESVLRHDATYPEQDFATRDRYRRVIEQLARRSNYSESDVARVALSLAEDLPADSPQSHVGYYLIDQGLSQLKSRLRYAAGLRERFIDSILTHPRTFYFGLIALGMLLATAVTGWAVWSSGSSGWAVAVACIVALLPASELVIGIANYLVTVLIPPRVLPKLSLKDGIPADCATFVVMPAMLLDSSSAEVLVERLEVHYLSNPDPNLRFALLTDFSDSKTEHTAEDERYVQAALQAIRSLNDRYGGVPRFFLLHRKRVWNPVQGCWMGWERKRGKLIEFNRWLRGARDSTFETISGNLGDLPPIRFCITLDADTRLPRDAARRLVGVMSHPLNRPQFDPAAGRVVAGYGVLQPRVSLRLSDAARSLFARIYSGSAGIDPYTTAVSDVYQDLFSIGSYTGKGIYDIDAFGAAVDDAFPENCILSHDLIEGNHARCGLVSDVELFDDFPARYDAYARREHRWVRGDWQILPWLFSTVPSANGPRSNPLPFVERWKIFDNLRRSVVPSSLLALLLVAWLIIPSAARPLTILALLVVFLPLELRVLGALVGMLRTGSMRSVVDLRGDVGNTGGQALLNAVFLAQQAGWLAGAVGRTLARVYWTHRNLLEWESAAATEKRLRGASDYLNMWPIPAFALITAAIVAWLAPQSIPLAAPWLIAWAASPAIAFWVSRPLAVSQRILGEQERTELRLIARKTWSFFEEFLGPEDNWLPPDNYQEDPKHVIAHRTSPTNIGMLLISTLAAHDLGYISFARLIERLEKTFNTLDSLERFHGHFFNWYDTRSGNSLHPGYISTVDSGNLLGCLIALSHGLREKEAASNPSPRMAEGLIDTLMLIDQSYRMLEKSGSLKVQRLAGIKEAIERMMAILAAGPAGSLASSNGHGAADWAQSLAELNRLASALLARINARSDPSGGSDEDDVRYWSNRLSDQIRDAVDELGCDRADLVARAEELSRRAEQFGSEMSFHFLYNDQRHLFSVGFNVATGRLDSAHYDLLASEACLTSLLAIARGEATTKHWFHLGRPVTRSGGSIGLVSWGGTMFEYLMPRLLLRAYADTMLARSYVAAVAGQVEYGRKCRVPWGISESAFGVLDIHRDYQYQSFGVPGLGLKRGLADELVVAPYATALATMVAPHEAIENFRRLSREGAEGRHGFYEAVDYTRSRLPEGRRSLVVKSFMAHHQGMSLIALANCLLGDPMPRRFHAAPIIRSVDLLLQERVPRSPPLVQPHSDEAAATPVVEGPHPVSRRLITPNTPNPRTHLISNGRYSVMVSNAGSGYSSCRGLDVSRWREDRTRDHWGQFLYVRDLDAGLVWSAGHQPVCRDPDEYEVVFSLDKAEFRRVDSGIGTNMEVTVAPEHNAEIRRIAIINHHHRARELELTSYVELALAQRVADRAHPAFGKLFLETEFVPEHGALLCKRRPRGDDQKPVWAVHVLAAENHAIGELDYETDRSRFIGRCRTPADPAALDADAALSKTTGSVLDPIFALRGRIRVEAGAAVVLAFTTAIADSREEALSLADQYHDLHSVTRAFELAWAHSQVELRQLKLSAEDAHLFQRIATHIIYASGRLRATHAIQAANRQGQTGLWGYGISGDLPICLVRINDPAEIRFADQLLTAHSYWRYKGLTVDLVIQCDEASGYFEELFQQVQALARRSDSHSLIDRPGGIFVRKGSQIPEEDQVLLQAAARVILVAGRGSLGSQVDRMERRPALPPRFVRGRASWTQRSLSYSDLPVQLPENLQFANQFGGFNLAGDEYVMRIEPDQPTPAPWINVVANPACGFLISEAGSGYTWAGNSQSNRLTPWNNDPVSDPPGEAIFLRDEVSGEFWSATMLPTRHRDPCLVRHGQGYSIFQKRCNGIGHELLFFVPREDPIKLMSLRVRNETSQPRKLSATFYAEWVLGTVRDLAPMTVITELDEHSGAILARNAFNQDFASRVAFADVNLRPRSFSADRTEFLGRNGSLDAPAAMGRTELSGRVGCNLDPCVALSTKFDLQPGEEKTIVFSLGQAADLHAVRKLVERYRQPEQVLAAYRAVREFWDQTLGAVQVETPNRALDVLVNRWLLYQSLVCRVWGRSAFYQSGGAYGFRDQLQDVMATVYGAPAETRAHIVRAAGRQFLEGDIQHWWHPPSGRGVRTRFSDDYLWLPLVVCHYVSTTGDTSVLDETAPFLRAPLLRPDQEDDFRLPETTDEMGTVYEHCVRAIEYGFTFGEHGLPLMGTGDWNDGMNRVGHHGKGETVWGGWFLATCLTRFAELAELRHDLLRAAQYRAKARDLVQAIENHAWDGAWYRRAYFDDGTPLGSLQNDECQIDSIAQSWAVLSGAADPERARTAMASLHQFLVSPHAQLIRLLTPPFDRGSLQPGYIKGYVPGIRENGGQYTHAATWVVQATALLGDCNRAMDLFNMISPIHHTSTAEGVARYKVEPYVVVADVYDNPQHVGRGGWTWYTGSASWLYRVALETLLGFQLRGSRLIIAPHIPDHWPGYAITYRYRSATYRIRVDNSQRMAARGGSKVAGESGINSRAEALSACVVVRVSLDGSDQPDRSVPLADDGRRHDVVVSLGVAGPASAGSAVQSPVATGADS